MGPIVTLRGHLYMCVVFGCTFVHYVSVKYYKYLVIGTRDIVAETSQQWQQLFLNGVTISYYTGIVATLHKPYPRHVIMTPSLI